MRLWSPPLRVLNRVSTSDRVPRLVASIGLAVVLLWAAFGVNVAVMVVSSVRVVPYPAATRLLRGLRPDHAALRSCCRS